MKRPTVVDLAEAAGVSVATIDRVLNGRKPVRHQTAQQVLDAAVRIGFYAEETIRARVENSKPVCTIGMLLQYPNSAFYQQLAHELRSAAAAFKPSKIKIELDFAEDLTPEHTAKKIEALAKRSNVLGVVSSRHPAISAAIEQARERGVPTFGFISELSAQCSVGYIGVDNWKVGRTAAWAFANICKKPGKIAIIVGNHRFRGQELSEIGFRSYFRDHPSGFEILEPLSTWGDNDKAEEVARRVLNETPELAGLYVAGGGISGALRALNSSDHSNELVTVGYQLSDETRKALEDGTINIVISYPLKHLAREAMIAMTGAVGIDPEFSLPSVSLPLEIYTPENI